MVSKIYPIEVILSLVTRRLLCRFDLMHECAEFIAGGPIFTHQFAEEYVCFYLQDAIIKQHPQLIVEVNNKKVNPNYWEEYVELSKIKYGETLELKFER